MLSLFNPCVVAWQQTLSGNGLCVSLIKSNPYCDDQECIQNAFRSEVQMPFQGQYPYGHKCQEGTQCKQMLKSQMAQVEKQAPD